MTVDMPIIVLLSTTSVKGMKHVQPEVDPSLALLMMRLFLYYSLQQEHMTQVNGTEAVACEQQLATIEHRGG